MSFVNYPLSGYLQAVANGPDGNVWATSDSLSIGVYRINPSGVGAFFGTGTGSNPSGLVTGPDGNVWFSDSYLVGSFYASVWKVTPAGVLTQYAFSTMYSVPSGITAGPDGRLWVATDTTSSSDSVAAVTTAGVVSQYAPANAHGTGICSDGTNLWFTDTAYNKVYQVNTSGAMLASYSTYGGTHYGICFDGTYIWTASLTGYLNQFTLGGTLTHYAIGGAPNFTDICFDGTLLWMSGGTGGYIWSCDPSNPLGTLTTYPCSGSSLSGICVDSNGYIWASDKLSGHGVWTNCPGPPPPATMKIVMLL